jgi:hypothetical protein
MPRTHALSLILLTATAGCSSSPAARPAPAPAPPAASSSPASSIAARTAGLEKRDGFLPLYLDDRQGKLLLEIPRDSTRALYFLSQATGLGSNPVGVDRGADGGAYVARFDRAGNRVLVVLENWNYRSSARDNPAHVRTVEESFPPSTVAAMPVVAEEGGRLLVDATDFFVQDWNDVAGTLAQAGQAGYSLARDRSGVYRPYTKAFPRNTEVEVSLTFATTGRPGSIVQRIVPDGRAFTVRQHASLVALPDDGYRPRAMDPRVGYFGVTFQDYGQPIQGSLDQRWVARHRLERVNPADPSSPIRNPIVYYIDRGIPEPIRTATKQGVAFWVDAFDRAGLKGGFRVEDLPEGVDPLDVRYNVVQWVNRNERGWSVGGSEADPRTGEIVKGMARLDSHRARTDYNLYAGLVGADSAAADTAFVLARVRQVSAHEVGHTLGLAHNYIASTYERGSVMDYPPPRVALDAKGDIDLSQAYGRGIGDYDVWAIRWGYGTFPGVAARDSLAAVVREGLARGFVFLSDADARPEYGSDPRVNLWDDAATAGDFLQRQMAVRRVAMSRFGLRNIRPDEPVATLQERFVPVYLMHRFAANGVAKTIGGVEYANALRGDAQQVTRPVPAARQRAALAALAAALDPKELAIPDTVITLLGPRPFGYSGSVELFSSRTRPTFDELGAARTLSQMLVDLALQRDRAARLVQQAAHDPRALTLGETIDALAAATWRERPGATPKLAALQRVAGRALADRLLALAADQEASPDVRAQAEYALLALRDDARRRARSAADVPARAHWNAIAADFTRWLDRRELPKPTPALVPPPGDPFGDEPAF